MAVSWKARNERVWVVERAGGDAARSQPRRQVGLVADSDAICWRGVRSGKNVKATALTSTDHRQPREKEAATDIAKSSPCVGEKRGDKLKPPPLAYPAEIVISNPAQYLAI